MLDLSRSMLHVRADFWGAWLLTFFLASAGAARAEVVEYSCIGDPKFGSRPLYFDTESKKVKYSEWPWSNESAWGEDFVVWTSIGTHGLPGAFIFKKDAGELIVLVADENLWQYLEYTPDYSEEIRPKRCVRGF